MDIINNVKKLDLPLGEYAVYGGAALEVLCIRETDGIDSIVTEPIYKQLKLRAGVSLCSPVDIETC